MSVSHSISELLEESKRRRVDFLHSELSLGFTFSRIAATRIRGGHREAALKAMENAEKAYTTVRRFIGDEKHARHLTNEESQNLKDELERLRESLEEIKGSAAR